MSWRVEGKLNARSQAEMRSEGAVVFSIQLVLARHYGRYSSEWSGTLLMATCTHLNE